MYMANINIRVDEKLKKQSQKMFQELGLDMSSAIKMFLQQTVHEKGLPFRPTRDPDEIVKQLDREVAYALKHGKRYSSAKELHDDLMKS